MAYATETQLATYLGVSEADLPDDAERLLNRASELIDYVTLNKIDSTDSDHTAAAQTAVCAQVEQWIELGDEGIIELQGISIGSFQAQFGAGANRTIPTLADRAAQALFLEGLLYRGVKIK